MTQRERDACNLAVDMLHSEIGELLNALSDKPTYDFYIARRMAEKDELEAKAAEEARA